MSYIIEDCCHKPSQWFHYRNAITKEKFCTKKRENAIRIAPQSVFVGMELEVEAQDGPGRYDMANELQEQFKDEVHPNFMFVKDDSSIRCGFEIVTHPFSFQWFKNSPKFLKVLDDLRKRGYRSYKTTTCGMHLHIETKSFTSQHLYKFMRFFYENQDFIRALSGRTRGLFNSWSPFINDTWDIEDDDQFHDGRRRKIESRDIRKMTDKKIKDGYCCTGRGAVNLGPNKTVEVRIFRGTLDPHAIARNIEFMYALHHFTKYVKVKDTYAGKFREFVSEKQKRYGELEKDMDKIMEKAKCS